MVHSAKATCIEFGEGQRLTKGLPLPRQPNSSYLALTDESLEPSGAQVHSISYCNDCNVRRCYKLQHRRHRLTTLYFLEGHAMLTSLHQMHWDWHRQ